MAEEDFDEFDEEDDDDGKGGSKALTKKLEELKNAGPGRASTSIARTVRQDAQGLSTRKATAPRPTTRPRKPSVDELMTIRFTAKTIEKLCDLVRGQVDDVRREERELRKIIVDKCGMPRRQFIKELPAQPAEPGVGGRAGRSRQALEHRAGRATSPAIQELQQNLIDLQSRVVVPLDELEEHQQAHERRRSATAAMPRRR